MVNEFGLVWAKMAYIADVQVKSKDYMVLEGNHIIVFTSVWGIID